MKPLLPLCDLGVMARKACVFSLNCELPMLSPETEYADNADRQL